LQIHAIESSQIHAIESSQIHAIESSQIHAREGTDLEIRASEGGRSAPAKVGDPRQRRWEIRASE